MGGSKLNTKNINHQITNFVDDNSNIISFKNHEDIKNYLENYFLLLIRFYNINKVKLNSDKTKLTIVSKNSMESIFKNFTFRAGNDSIKNAFFVIVREKYHTGSQLQVSIYKPNMNRSVNISICTKYIKSFSWIV